MILVVGDVMTDVIVHPSGALAHGTDRAAAIETRAGGSGANVACWIGHLGRAVAFVGRVGRADAVAQHAALEMHGVQAKLAIDDTAPTGSIVAIVAPGGERSFYTDRGANRYLCAADLRPVVLDGVVALHVSGHALLEARPRRAVLALMQAASARGAAVSVDAGSQAWLEQAGPDHFAGWIAAADTCFANAAEASLLEGRWAGSTLVVTEGAAGARAVTRDTLWRVPAPEVAVQDGIGAGDAFAAGFLAARVGGAALAQALQGGVAAARLAIATPGGRPPRAAAE